MSILRMLTADLQDLSILDSYQGSFTLISTNYARTGSRSFLLNSNLGNFTTSFTSSSEIYIKFAMLTDGTNYFYLYLKNLSEAITHLSLRFTPTSVNLYRSSSIFLEGASIPTYFKRFVVFQLRVTIDNSTGICQLKANNDLVIDYTGNTQNGGSIQEINNVQFGNGTSLYLDDIVIRDDTWPGLGGIHVLSPNSGSTNENWTASAGNPEDCVDELPVSYSDYIYTNGLVDNTEQLFGIESLPNTPSSIYGVGIYCNNLAPNPTSSQIRTLLKSGTTTDVGNNHTVSTSESWAETYYHQNPDDTAAWEEADITALEIGAETIVP